MTLGHSLHGSGPETVIVLHDWMGDSGSYDAVRPWLDAARFTYAFADLRGYGRSRDLMGVYTVEECARDVLDLADALGWPRFHLIGHSMTGMVTELLSLEAPQRLKSAVAVCPVSAAGNKLDPASEAFFARAMEDDEAFVRLIRFITGLGDGFARETLRRHRARVAPVCRLGYLRMLTGTDFAARMRGLVTPFLVLIGDRDPGLDEAAMRRTFLAWHPDAELKTIANSGHYPMEECPPYFAMLVEDFLGRHT